MLAKIDRIRCGVREERAGRDESLYVGSVPAKRTGKLPVKPQQNLVGIIRDIVALADSPVSYAAIRAELDSSERYQFKSGVEGYYRTRQITSAVHNHIRKYGERALLQKTADGKVAVRN